MHIVPLRGRAREQAAITGVLAGAAAGRGGALLIAGEPGLGRTALLRDAACRAAARFSVLATEGFADEAALPYAAVQRLLQPLAGRLTELAPRHAEVLAGVLDGGGCPAPDRLLLSVAVLALLDRAAAAGRPVLCTVDDVHVLDPASAALLAFVARRLDTRRVAVLFTGDAGHALDGVPRLRLAALGPGPARRLLADLVPGLPEATAADLAGIAGGNPLGLTDLARSLTPGQRAGAEAQPVELPADGALRRAYRRRLSLLPAATRWLLLLAAADPELDTAGLLRAARASGTGIAALAPAEEAGLITVHSGPKFTHPVVRTIAYGEAPLARRRAAHLLLVRVLTGERDRLRRAVHLAAAAPGPDPRLAAELADAAVDTAVDAGGYAAASTALERAAELTAEPRGAAARLIDAARYAWLAGSPHRARTLLYGIRPAAGDRDVEGRTLLLTGELELRSGAAAAALRSLLAAADTLADGDRQLAAGALMRAGEAICFCGDHFRYADIERRASILRRPDECAGMDLMFEHIAGFAATFGGRHEHAIGPLRRVVALAARLDDAVSWTWASAASLLLGNDTAAGRQAARAIELARASGDESVPPRALELQACAEYWLGRYDAAAATSLRGLRAARASGQDNCAGNHLGMLAVLAAIRGDRQSCLRHVRDLPGVPRTSRPRALGEWALAVLDLAAGHGAEAVSRLTAIADPATGRGHVVVQVMAAPYLVEAAARSADPTAAAPALGAFDRWASSTRDPLRRALVARCRALLAPRGSGEAEEQFREALRLHRCTESDFERARTELLFGRELRRARRPRDAREHLLRALETFQRQAARTWAEQSTAELRAAGEPAVVPAVGREPVADALTAQQLRIARLVVDGATNREVAERLLLSTRTVDHHMRNIFSRLGIRSRIELAKRLNP